MLLILFDSPRGKATGAFAYTNLLTRQSKHPGAHAFPLVIKRDGKRCGSREPAHQQVLPRLTQCCPGGKPPYDPLRRSTPAGIFSGQGSFTVIQPPLTFTLHFFFTPTLLSPSPDSSDLSCYSFDNLLMMTDERKHQC